MRKRCRLVGQRLVFVVDTECLLYFYGIHAVLHDRRDKLGPLQGDVLIGLIYWHRGQSWDSDVDLDLLLHIAESILAYALAR